LENEKRRIKIDSEADLQLAQIDDHDRPAYAGENKTSCIGLGIGWHCPEQHPPRTTRTRAAAERPKGYKSDSAKNALMVMIGGIEQSGFL